MGQNGSTNCCGTTADCQQTEVEVSEYQINQNSQLKRPAQITSQSGVILNEQQQKFMDEQQLLLQQQQHNQGNFSSKTKGGDNGSMKKKNMKHHELANHLRKISNNDRIIMENSIIHSTSKTLHDVTSAKKLKKELGEIVHFAKVLQLRIISSSTLQKGSVLYINAQGLENSLRKELDGVTYFGCKKRCRNIDNFNLQQGQLDNFSSYSSSSSNEDEFEEDDTFNQVDQNQILDDIYDDVENQNKNQNKQQQKSLSSHQSNNLYPQQKNQQNSKNISKLQQISQQKSSNHKNQFGGKNLEEDFKHEEEKENNPHQMNSKQRSNIPLNNQGGHKSLVGNSNQLAKKSNQPIKQTNNQLNINTSKNERNSSKTDRNNSNNERQGNYNNNQLIDGRTGQTNKNSQLKRIEQKLSINNKNLLQEQNQKKPKINKNGEVANDFVIPSPDPEISKRHRGKHFQIAYSHSSNSYRIKDLGIGFGCFYKLECPLLLKDNHLLNIGLIFVVVNFTLNQDNTVLDTTSNNKSSNTTQNQYPSNTSQIKNSSMSQSQNISNNKNNLSNNNQNQIQLKQNQFTSLNQSVDFVDESINKISIRLKFFGGPCNGESCILDPQKETLATIGRNKEQCSICFDDHLLSKIQCRIVFKPNEGWYLIDGSQKRPSTNGSWLYLAEEQEIYEGMVFKANQTLFQCNLQ